MHYVRGAVAADTDTHVHLCRMAVDFDRMWACWEKGWSARESVGDLAEAMKVPRVGPEVSFVVEDQPPFSAPPAAEGQPYGLRAALRVALDALESARGNINPERGFADVVEAEIEDAIEAAREELEKYP